MSDNANPVQMMPFSQLMGVVVTHVDDKGVFGELVVKPDLCTSNSMVHGGALMAFADALGAVGAMASLPDGAAGTTTIESKTNFLRAASVGSVLKAHAVPVKLGKRMSVWQTTIRGADEKEVALVTQTQLVL